MSDLDAVRRMGLLPHSAEKESRRLGAHLHPDIAAALKVGPVGHADLSEFLPPVFNQGNCSGCWAHSGAACLDGAHAQAGKPLDSVPSPLYFMKAHYSRLRGLAFPSGPLPKLIDTGADLDAAAETFKVLGEHALEAPQQDGDTDVPATSDVNGAIPLQELDEQEVADGMAAVFDGEYAIFVGSDAPDLLMATLDAGIFVWDGFMADKALENLKAGDVLGAPGKGLGGHSTLYWGYDLLKSGPVYYKRNSWGRSYCRNGDFTVNSAHVLAAWSLWPFAVKVSP